MTLISSKTVRPEDVVSQGEEGSPRGDDSAADNDIEGLQDLMIL